MPGRLHIQAGDNGSVKFTGLLPQMLRTETFGIFAYSQEISLVWVHTSDPDGLSNAGAA